MVVRKLYYYSYCTAIICMKGAAYRCTSAGVAKVILLQAAHRTTDYMYIDTGVENSSLYRATTAGLVAKL